MEPQPPPPLPGALRLALLTAVTVGALVSFGAARDVSMALTITGPAPMDGSEAALPGLGLSPQAQRAVWLAMLSGMRGAIAGMTTSRVIISMLLSSAASLVFVLALRLRWSMQGPRELVATLLSRVSVGAAVLRTLDGAQQLVVARSTAEAIGKALVREGVAEAQALGEAVLMAYSALTIGWTVLVVGLFVGLSRYLASDAVRAALGQHDLG